MKKRILSIALSIVMLVGLLPTTAGAMPAPAPAHTAHYSCGVTDCNADHNGDAEGEGHSEVTDWTSWAGGTISYTDDTASVYLSRDDVKLTSTLQVESGKTLYLCLNGKTLSFENDDNNVIKVNSGGTLYLCNCSDKGKITSSTGYASLIYNLGTAYIMSGTVEGSNGLAVENRSGTLTVGGTAVLTADTTAAIRSYSGTVYVCGSANITSAVSTGEAIYIYQGGKLYISGSPTVSNSNCYALSALGGGEMHISGSPTISGKQSSGDIFVRSGAKFYIDGEMANSSVITVVCSNTNPNSYAHNAVIAEGGGDYTLTDEDAAKFKTYKTRYTVIQKDNALVINDLEAPHSHDMSVECGDDAPVTFTAWDGTGNALGAENETTNVYLSETPTARDSTLTVTGTVNLCLNGHSITSSADYAIEVSDGAVLNLCDCKGSGTVSGDDGIYNEGGTVNLYGGTVSGTTYGIYNSGGEVTVSDGTVSGDAGIYSNGTAIVEGGTITGAACGIQNCGGSATVGGSSTVSGTTYGIYNYTTLELSGSPTISGTAAGICLLPGKVITISGALSNTTPYSVYTVAPPTAGSPVAITSGWAAMGDAEVSDYFDSAVDDYIVQPNSETGELELAVKPPHSHYNCGVANCTTDHNGDASGNGHSEVDSWIPLSTVLTYDSDSDTYNGTLPSDNYYLDKDMTIGNKILIEGTEDAPVSVNICLNGHQLKGTAGRRILSAEGTYRKAEVTSLSICDCYDSSTHTGAEYTHTYTSPISGEEKTVTGGLITGATGSNGRPVYCYEANVTMYGGTIAGNGTGNSGFSGGAVEVAGGNFAMYGGSVTDNYTRHGAAGLSAQSAEIRLVAGSITDNAVYSDSLEYFHGTGGVYVHNSASLSIHEGFVISGNKGGVQDGSAGFASNLYLSSDVSAIELAGKPGAPIGIRMANPGIFTEGYGNIDSISLSDFVSEQKGYFLTTEGEGTAAEVKLEPYAITTQPTTDTPQVVTNKPDDIASHSWHVQSTVTVDDTVAAPYDEYAAYADGAWTGSETSSGGEWTFFKIALEAGEILTVTVTDYGGGSASYFSLWGYGVEDVRPDDNYASTVNFYIPVSGTYAFRIGSSSGDPKIAATLTKNGSALDGQITATLTDGTDGETYVCKVTFKDGTVLVSDPVAVHNHSWTYSGSGNTITATCGGDSECDFSGNTTITIVKPTLTKYQGSGSENATIKDGKTSIGGIDTLPAIVYEKRDGTDLGTTPPTLPGDYKASITVGSATASVEYTIGKKSSSFYDNIDGDYTISDITHNSFKVTIEDVHGLRSLPLEYAVEDDIDGNNYTAATLDENYCFTVTVDDELIGEYIEFGLRVKAPDEYTEPGAMDTEMVQLLDVPVPTTYTVTVTNDGNGTASASPTSGTTGTEITLTAAPNNGYHFKEWQVISGGVMVSDNKFTIGTADVEIKAVFEADTPGTYTVTYLPGENGTGTQTTDTKTQGIDLTLKGAIFTRTGYTQTGWATTDGGAKAYELNGTYSADGAVSLYPVWTANNYTVTVTNNGNGTASASPTSGAEGTEITLTATPDSGYQLKEWQVVSGGITVTDNKFTMPASNVEIVAVFEVNTFTVSGTVQDNEMGTATVNLMQGNSVIKTTTASLTGSDSTYTGTYSFTDVAPGVYNIVVTKGDVTMTVLVTITDANVTVGTITMPDGKVNSKLEVKDEGGVVTPDVVVDGLQTEAEAVKTENGAATEVTVTMTVQAEAVSASDQEQTAIKNAAPSGATIEYLDITVKKTVVGGSNAGTSNISETSSVLEIVVPYDFNGKENVTVYRKHLSEAAAPLSKLNSEPGSPADGTFFLDEQNGRIHIYARKFSTYAIGYTNSGSSQPIQPPTTGGGGGYTPTYAITVEDAVNGEVKANRSYASSGSTVTITATPEDGYILGKLTVKDEQGNNIVVTDKGDGTYTFKMPSRKVTVEASFVVGGSFSVCPKDNTCPIWPYTDAETTAWYHDGVHYCIENGLMSGYGNGIFKPNADTTRAMITVMLWRLNDSPVVNYLLDFEDVEEGQWYTEAIRWAKSEGIAEGYGNGFFGTNDAITREQMVTILWRYAQHKGIDVSVGEDTNILSYDDAFDVAEYAIPAMQWACGSGMVQGMNDPDGEGMILAPESKGTRAQIATMMMRFCTEIVK